MKTSTSIVTGNPMESNDSFYDSIAASYDGLMTASDGVAREAIIRVFCAHVRVGKVLDFGSGTGLDLPWLAARGYTIFSLEPSAGMRAEAAKRMAITDAVTFVTDNLDYQQWSEDNVPFRDVNGVLANFAVANCMEDLRGFFEKIKLVLGSDGRLVLTVIDPRWHNIVEKYSTFVALRLLIKGKLEILRRYKGKYHKTYLYSRRAVREAAKDFFTLHDVIPIEGSGFIVFIFKPA